MADDVIAGAIKLLLGDDSEQSSMVDPEDELVSTGTMTDFPSRCFLAYGEPVLRFDQVNAPSEGKVGGDVFRRTVYSKELQLAQAVAALGNHSEFFTVLPPSPQGELVKAVCLESGTILRAAFAEEGNHIGDMTITRSGNWETVHQRRYSAFHNKINHFRWDKGILSDRSPCWVHTSLSSFLWTENGLRNWSHLFDAAADPKRNPHDVLMSMELGSVESDAPFADLWTFVFPFLKKMYLLVITPEECLQIAAIMGLDVERMHTRIHGDPHLQPWIPIVDTLRRKTSTKCIVVYFTQQSEDSVRFIVSHETGLTLLTPSVFTTVYAHLAKLVHAFMHVGALEDKERFQSLINDLTWSRSIQNSRIASPNSPKDFPRRSIIKQVIEEMSE